ncbi:retrovirus-related pol polyprotein from transposon TNT 1-94 [Tanacetum coccineum]
MHNNILAAGSKDRPPMIGPGRITPNASTRYKGKEIAKPITPQYESVSVSDEDNDPEQAQRDKEMQKNLALLAKYFKKLYKPHQTTNFRASQTPGTRLKLPHQVGSQVVQQTGIQCFNCKGYGHYAKECRKPKRGHDEEIDEHELEALTATWTRFRSLREESSLLRNTKVISDLKVKEEKDIDKMIEMDKQLKFLNEIVYTRNQSIQTIHMLAPKCSTYNGRPTFANPRYLKKAQSEKPCLYEIPYDTSDPANRFAPDREETMTLDNESRSKLNKDYVKPYDYTKQNSLYEIFKAPSLEYLYQLERAKEVRKTMWRKPFVRTKPNIAKNVAFLPVSKSISKSRQVFNDMTFNINQFIEIVDQTWRKHTSSCFRVPTAHDMELLIKTLLMPLSIKSQNDSFRFEHELKTEMHEDFEYVKSLEKEIDELESEKADFSNMYDLLIEECVSKDVTCSYLHSLSDLNAYAELQCLYLHKVKECECLAQKLSKQTESVNNEVHNKLLKSFSKLEKHSISLELSLQHCKEQMKNNPVCKENASNVFRKEREQYHEIQDLKAQMQDKNMVINELKKLILVTKGKSVETQFDKPSVVRQPNAQRIPKPSVLGKPTPFSNSPEMRSFQTKQSVNKTNVSDGLFKPVTKQNLPQNRNQAIRNTNVLKPGMFRIASTTTQNRTPQLPHASRNTNPHKSKSFRSNSTLLVLADHTLSAIKLKISSCRKNSPCEVSKEGSEDHHRLLVFLRKQSPVTAVIDMFKLQNFAYVNARTKKPNVVPISASKPNEKKQTNPLFATPHKKTVASDTTIQKSKSYYKKLYENTNQEWRWWIAKRCPSDYTWTQKPLRTKKIWMPKIRKDDESTSISPTIDIVSRITNIVQLILFIVDSGCTKHMTGNLKLLCNFVEKFLGTVRFGNDQFAPILGYGDLIQGNVTIKRVYYVEGLNHNLFSVGQFCDADLEVAFRKSTCFVRDLQGNDLLTGSRGSDLYTISLQETTSSTPICFMAKASPTQAWLWHRRLSHLNFDYITLLSKKEVVNGLPKLKYVKDQLCSSCEMSKAKRSSFKTKAVPSSKGRLNLLHMDLCGPMRVASINGKKYILVIVDDYSRYTWTLFLRSKDETPEVLKDFLTMIQRNLQAQVIIVRTDRGTEFLNKTLHAYFKEEGIEHQTSTPRTPEQNGVVERQNRTLVEAARTMLSASKLPLSFWAEAVATACYTQNRSIIISTHGKTAYHIINDRKPSIKHLHIFGCICYITRDGENLDKMKEKGDPCVMVGYSTQSKGYRVYNKRTRLIVESIHIKFDEIKEMMSDHNSSDLAPQRQEMSVENVSSGLVPQGQKASDYDNSDPVPPRQNVVPTAEKKTDSYIMMASDIQLDQVRGKSYLCQVKQTTACTDPVMCNGSNQDVLSSSSTGLKGIEFEDILCPVARLEAGSTEGGGLRFVSAEKGSLILDHPGIKSSTLLRKALYGLKQAPRACRGTEYVALSAVVTQVCG